MQIFHGLSLKQKTGCLGLLAGLIIVWGWYCLVILVGTSMAQFRWSPIDFATLKVGPSQVFLCRRLVDDWRVQLLLPGLEHYSLWLPNKKLHRGVIARWYGQPIYWVNEVYIDLALSPLPNYLDCESISSVDETCVAQAVQRQIDEGRLTWHNHCQTVALDILATCSDTSTLGRK